jgi:hypothetical protein
MAVAIRSTDFPEGVGPDTYDVGMDPAAGPQPTRSEYSVHNYIKPD